MGWVSMNEVRDERYNDARFMWGCQIPSYPRREPGGLPLWRETKPQRPPVQCRVLVPSESERESPSDPAKLEEALARLAERWKLQGALARLAERMTASGLPAVQVKDIPHPPCVAVQLSI
jgi:hypothetical protein